MSERVVCVGCGYGFNKEQMFPPLLVNLRDGSQRHILLDGQICCDFWDETKPGDWVSLADGTEVQRVYWQCDGCEQVFAHTCVKRKTGYSYVECASCEEEEEIAPDDTPDASSYHSTYTHDRLPWE